MSIYEYDKEFEEKKLEKGKSIKQIAVELEESREAVQKIVNELKNEKIDIIKWSKQPEEFIANSLSPAKVLEVKVNEEDKTAKVVVDDNQLSLAIGKEGQNVRLAAKLTNWKIDIKSKSQAEMQANENVEETTEEAIDTVTE